MSAKNKGGRHSGRLSSGARIVLTTAEAKRGIDRASRKKAKTKPKKKTRRKSRRGIW